MVSNTRPLPIYRSIQEDMARIVTFSPRDINWGEFRIKGLLLQSGKWVRKKLPFPNAVYNWRYSDDKWILKKLEQIMGTDKTFNSITRFDKWNTYRILKDSSIGTYQPYTELYSPNNLRGILEKHQASIIKPRKGHLGQDIHLIRMTRTGEYQLFQYNSVPIFTSKSWRGIIRHLQKHLTANDYVVQQFVPFTMINKRIFDIRLLVQKSFQGTWNVTAMLSRVAVRDYFVTNVCRAITSVEEVLAHQHLDQQELLDLLTQTSLQTARLLDKQLGLLGEISVDYGLDEQNHPWIIEVNGMPSKELFIPLRDRKIIKRVHQSPLEYAYYLATKK